MSKYSARRLAIYTLSALSIWYLTDVYFAYQRMPVEHKIYLQIVDTGKSGSVIRLPIPNFMKLLLWERIGGRNEVFQYQQETGKAFLFVMNSMDYAEENEMLELRTVEALKLARELLCADTSVETIGKYQAYADLVDSSSLKAYLDEFRSASVCGD